MLNHLKTTAASLLAFTVQADSYRFVNAPPEIEPTPGSISSTLKVSSLNNILQLAAPLTANEMFKDKTYDINYVNDGFLGIYKIQLDSIHSNDVDGFTSLGLEFIEDTNDLMLTIGGVNIDVSMTGFVQAAGFIKGNIEGIKVTNATF